MKNFKLKRLLSLAFIGCLSTLSATTVYAAAGEVISNTARLYFTIGGNPDNVVSPAAIFTEDNLVNFTVATTDGARVSVSPSATDRVLTFTVTNNGNGAQDFALSALNLADNFDPASYAIYVDSGNGGGYDALDVATFIDELPSDPGVSTVDNVATVYIVSTIPIVTLPLADGDIADMTLVAEVHAGDVNGVSATAAELLVSTNVGAAMSDNSGDPYLKDTEQNVFNDPAGIAPDVAKDGLHSDTSGYVIASAILAVLKESEVIWDPVNEATLPKAIPGAYVKYTLKVSNTGTASGILTTLFDDFALNNLEIDVDFMNGAATQVPTSGFADNSFQIDTTGTARPSGAVTYCTADPAIVDGDGCTSVLGAAGSVTVDFGVLAATTDVLDVTYADGEIKPGDVIIVKFNAIIN